MHKFMHISGGVCICILREGGREYECATGGGLFSADDFSQR